MTLFLQNETNRNAGGDNNHSADTDSPIQSVITLFGIRHRLRGSSRLFACRAGRNRGLLLLGRWGRSRLYGRSSRPLSRLIGGINAVHPQIINCIINI